MIQEVSAGNTIKVKVEIPEGVKVRSMEHTVVVYSDSLQSQYQLFPTETTTISEGDDNGQRHLFPVPVDPPREALRPIRPAQPRGKSRSLWKLFKQRDVQEYLAAESKMNGHRTAVKQFCLWFVGYCRQNEHRSAFPEVASIEGDRNLLQKYFQHKLETSAVSTAESHLSGMSCFWRALHELGYCKVPCPTIRKKRILKTSGAKKTKHIPIGCTLDDAKTWCEGVGKIPVSWLRNHFRRHDIDLCPRRFVQLTIGSSLFYGLNIGDLIAIKKKHQPLSWNDISRDALPPFRGAETIVGAEWSAGWVKLCRSKTSVEAYVPICSYLDELLNAFAGFDESIALPMPSECSAAWYRTLRNAKKAAGIYHTQAALKEAEEKNIVDVYDISMSDKAPSRSCRKRAAILWKQHGNRSQASHILAHSTQSGQASVEDLAATNDVASDMTERHYGGSEIYADIVQSAPKVFDAIESVLQLL